MRFDSPGATVLASVALAGASLTAVNWADDNARVASYRDVLLLVGILFLLLARVIWAGRRVHAKQLAAVAGLVLIGGSYLGNTSFDSESLFGLGSLGTSTKDGWLFILIAVTIGLLAFAAWQRHGGSAFVGLVRAYAFVALTASGGDLSGWPLILGIVTLLCLIWALVVGPSRQKPGAGAVPHAPQPPL